jgi:hypothetical protein
MPRHALLVFAALLVGGCRTPPESEQLGSPGSSVAGTETKRDGHSPNSRSQDGSAADSSGLANSLNSLIAVATTSASEAQPCERVCGSLGDCLLVDDDYSITDAGGLELQCLDRCVHSPDTAPAKAEFLACGEQSECGPLQACAEQTWTALAEARQGPEVAGVIASADPCKLGCRWVYSCMTTGSPPGEAYVDDQIHQYISMCVEQCDHSEPVERDWYARMASCLPNHCTLERYAECWTY